MRLSWLVVPKPQMTDVVFDPQMRLCPVPAPCLESGSDPLEQMELSPLLGLRFQHADRVPIALDFRIRCGVVHGEALTRPETTVCQLGDLARPRQNRRLRAPIHDEMGQRLRTIRLVVQTDCSAGSTANEVLSA